MPHRTKSSPTDRVFSALASPTRRDILDLLLEGPLPVHEIASQFHMARPSVSEHLRVLLDVGLVTETRQGRQRYYAVQADPLMDLVGWLTPYEQFWRRRLQMMRGLLSEGPAESGQPQPDGQLEAADSLAAADSRTAADSEVPA